MKRMTALLLGLALVIPTLAFAQPAPGEGAGMGRHRMGRGCGPMAGEHCRKMKHPGGPGMGMRMKMAAKLELTDDQKAKMEKLRTDFQLLMIDQQAKVRKAQVQLRQLMRDDKAAGAAVEAQIDQVAKYRAETAKMRFRHRAEMQGILTDKQKEMMKEMRMKGPDGMRGDLMDDDFEGQEDAPHPDGEEG